MFVMMARRLLADTTVNFAVIRPMLFCCVMVKPVYTTGGTLKTTPPRPVRRP